MTASLHLGLSLAPTWLRGAAWRRPDSRVEEMFDLDFYADAAGLAQDAGLDFCFIPDPGHLDPSVLGNAPGFSTLDSMTLAAALAGRTDRIGLIPTVHTLVASPYTAARRLQSLARLSGGRAGWNAVTALGGLGNHGSPEIPGPERYARAAEFIKVVRAVSASYPVEALRLDRAAAVFADTSAIRPPDHHGAFFEVDGPSTVPALDGGKLPLFQAGGSPAGRDFAAANADAVFAAAPTLPEAIEQRTDLKRRALAHGRAEADLRVLPGLSLFLDETSSGARALAAASAGPAGASHWTIVGTAVQAADQIHAWAEAGAIDGLIALPGGSWDSLRIFCTQVVPLLAQRGLASPGEGSLAQRLRLSQEGDFSRT